MRNVYLSLVVAALLSGCGASGERVVQRVPSLYTNANAQAVWVHPEQHLGAEIDVRGRVKGVTRVRQGVVVALALPGALRLIGAHVFDRHFRARRDAMLHVIGRVRGPLGSPDVPGVPQVWDLSPGVAVIDAQAASIEGLAIARTDRSTGAKR
jgi:uncharacterized protein YceK